MLRFDEPVSAPVATPINLSSATLATTFVLVDDINDRIWINAVVRWFGNFTVVTTGDVTFTLLRDGVPVFSVIQTAFNPLLVATTISNVARLQYVDQPLAGISPTVIIPQLPMPVTYTLQATSPVALNFTTGPITLSAAEIEANSII